jgi:PPOX class probable F420-dependent enzyme
MTGAVLADTFTAATRAIFAKQVLAHVASLGPDGEPNVTPVWVELDGDDIVINTALGRAKARNLASDSRVAVSLTDPDDPRVVVAVRGTVVGFTTVGEIRVTVRIQPDRISRQPD